MVKELPMLKKFYLNDGINFLNKTHDELLVSIRIPSHEGWLMGYKELRRRDSIEDFPVLSVATALHLEQGGVCKNANRPRGQLPHVLKGALQSETLLKGEKPDAELIETSAISQLNWQNRWKTQI